MVWIFSIFLFIICVYFLGRILLFIFIKKLKEILEMEEREEEIDVEIEIIFEMKGIK